MAIKIKNPVAPEYDALQLRQEAVDAGVSDQFDTMVMQGESPRMALMLAMQSFPGTRGTDAVFNKLERDQMKRYDEGDMARIIKQARAAGISTTGKTYNGQLGRYTDPAAWISGTSDVRKAAAEKGLSLRGQVNVENRPKPRKQTKLSERLIAESMAETIQADPKTAEKCRKSKSARRELRERVIEKHAPKSSSKPK